MAVAVDLSQLPAKLGTYAQTNLKQLLSAILLKDLSFMNYFGNTLVTNDEVPIMQLVMNSVLQPGAKDAFNPTGAGVFKARIGKVRPCKVDLTFSPSRIEAMWKSYIGMIDGGKIDAAVIPFEAFIILKVIEKVKEDLQLRAVFKGVLNGAGTTPADTMDGLIKLIQAAGTSGEIPGANIAAAPGGITESNAGDKFKAVFDKVAATNDAYFAVPMVCAASPNNVRKYNIWYQTTYGALPYNKEFNKTYLDGTLVELTSEPGLSGTDHIFITPKDNLFWLVDNQGKQEQVTVEKEKRNIHFLMDFNAAPDFGMGQLIWTNIQAA